jgi:hypothetical protein
LREELNTRQIAISCRLIVEVQDNKPSGYRQPDQHRYGDTKGNHASTTATNPTNMIVSVTQYRGGF